MIPLRLASKDVVVAFDLGGVLVDVDKTSLASLGPHAEAAFFDGDRHDRVNTGQLHSDEWIADAARRLGCAPARAHRAWSQVVSWAPGGLELLQEVARTRDLGCRVWSNTDAIHWARLKPAAYSVDVALSFQLGCAKPDPRFFAQALAGLDYARVLFLDDREQNVEAARHAGVEAHVCWGAAAARALLCQRGLLPSAPKPEP